MDKSKLVVLIENGHGVDTKGKKSPDGRLLEYQWTREVAHMLSDALSKEGIENKLIVPETKDISLSTRVTRANNEYLKANKEGKSCILISIHNNAAGNGGWHDATGFCVYVSKNASSKSKILAQCIYAEADKAHLKGNRCVPKEHYWVAGFYIIQNTKMPAVLTENLFQDNRDDVEYLLSEQGKKVIVQCHLNGILEYIQKC